MAKYYMITNWGRSLIRDVSTDEEAVAKAKASYGNTLQRVVKETREYIFDVDDDIMEPTTDGTLSS